MPPWFSAGLSLSLLEGGALAYQYWLERALRQACREEDTEEVKHLRTSFWKPRINSRGERGLTPLM